ncbi:MAG: methyltransferase domain-containing protein [Solirubrobacterales bacterium]
MGTFRQKAGTAKRRLLNARGELFPKDVVSPVALATSRRSVTPQDLGVERGTATQRLHAKISPDTLAEIARHAAADETLVDFPVPPGAPPRKIRMTQEWEDASGLERKRLDLRLGAHYAIPAFLEETGITTALPPEHIHAMTHSPLAAGGDFYHADLVADALVTAGSPLAAGDNGLDFGCSSARVTRALAASYPEVNWHGCDPNGPAIGWASENLPGIDFHTSGNEPPLPYPDDHFAVAFGISIWSHYAEALALRWYDEIWRVLRPGGHLISTTHGPQSVAFYGEIGLRTAQQLSEIKDSLYGSGYWYAPEFGDKGDWGVVNSEWGTSFVTAEWMLDKLCPKWQIVEYATARNENNQDVYVLRKPA